MAYQFFHIEAYSLQAKSYEREITITKKRSQGRRKKTKKTETRSIKEIMEEQARIDEACPHVDEPRRPGLLYGVPPMEVLPLAEEWADQAKDARGYKVKKMAMWLLWVLLLFLVKWRTTSQNSQK